MAALAADLPTLNAGVTSALGAVTGAADADASAAAGGALATLVASEGITTLHAVSLCARSEGGRSRTVTKRRLKEQQHAREIPFILPHLHRPHPTQPTSHRTSHCTIPPRSCRM